MALAITGCGGQSSAPPESASQLLADGTKALRALKSNHITGTLSIDQLSGRFEATVLQNGDSSGYMSVGSDTSKFVVVSHLSYFDTLNTFVTAQLGSAVTDLATRLKGMHWWSAPGSPPAAAVLQMLSTNSLISTFLSGRHQLSQAAAKDARGRSAIRLSDAAGSVFVATAAPHQILEIRTAPQFLAGAFSDVDLIFDHSNAPVSISAPPSIVTPAPYDMPAFFYVQSVDFSGCNTSGCDVKAVVQGMAGSGAASVVFTITDTSSRTLASCTGTAMMPELFESKTVTCHATGSGWAHWYLYVGGNYTVRAITTNPAYN